MMILALRKKYILVLLLSLSIIPVAGQMPVDKKFTENYQFFFPDQILSVLRTPDTLLLIFPDNKKYSESEQKIIDNLHGFSNYLNSIKIVKGNEAIKNNAFETYDVVAFGSNSNNSWIKKYEHELPSGYIKQNFENNNLNYIYTWYNPLNYKKASLIHEFDYRNYKSTAQILHKGQICVSSDSAKIFTGWYNLRNDTITISNERDSLIYEILKLPTIKGTKLPKLPSCSYLTNNYKNQPQEEITSISSEDINKDFSNIDDLKWLKPVAQNNNVVLVGENHYFKTHHRLVTRLFFALNKYDHFSTIILEGQFSKTPIINYYLTLSGRDSAMFYKKFIDKIVSTKQELLLINNLKHWNNKNPNKTVKIGYSDIEHKYKLTINDILIPILNKSSIDTAKFEIKPVKHRKAIPDFITAVEKALNNSTDSHFDFVSRDQFKLILNNLQKTFIAYENRAQAFSNVRNKQYIKNVIYFSKNGQNNILAFGGSNHFNDPHKPDTLNVYYYLNTINTPTKGKTYSIRLLTMSYNYKNIDFTRSLEHMGSGYIKKIERGEKFCKSVTSMRSVNLSIFSNKTPLNMELLATGCIINHKPFVFDSNYWESRLKRYKQKAKLNYTKSKFYYDHLNSFDKAIIIPNSELINAR